jgi:hypothetical protein
VYVVVLVVVVASARSGMSGTRANQSIQVAPDIWKVKKKYSLFSALTQILNH